MNIMKRHSTLAETLLQKIEDAISITELLELEKQVLATNFTDLDSEYLLSVIRIKIETFN